MASPYGYGCSTVVGDPLVWTPVVAITDVDGFEITNKGAADMAVRTDEDDAGTEFTLPAGSSDAIYPRGVLQPRFNVGATIVYIKPVSGTGPAFARFIA